MTDVTVVANQTYQGQLVQNVLVFSNMPSDVPSLQQFADAFRGLWSTQLASEQAPQWQLDNMTFIFNESLPIYSVTLDFTLGVLVGQNVADGLPTQVSCLVSTTYLGEPPNRGRVYFSGLTESGTAVGLFTSQVYLACQNLVDEWIDGITYGLNTAFLRIARRLPDGTIEKTNPAEAAIGRDVPAVQRRRRIGQGA